VSGSRCRFAYGSADATATHYDISCSSKSRLVLPFRCRLTKIVLDKIQQGCKTVVSVCVCVVCVSLLIYTGTTAVEETFGN